MSNKHILDDKFNLPEINHQDQANKKKVAQKIKKKNVTNNFQLHQKKKKKGAVGVFIHS